MALNEYRLSTLRFVYTSKLRKELQYTITNLRKTLEWSQQTWPVPQRLPRRAYRFTYLKGPFKGKIAQRHFVFHDWQYQFTFRDVEDVQSAVSTVLGSMTPETSCTCQFFWHFDGSTPYTESSLADEEERERCKQDLERGLVNVWNKNSEEAERKKTWYQHQQFYNSGFKSGPV
eukprot:TRINITY_DN37620_c0_g2_i1.p1 TRINITY_DN37620_c0_g2~~TRINITY_DN37620_c0_g2_i1.p1  ORF type:complete len:174 (-),score=23.85 TRINITY_DN37620_c0_g2_i1:48-569(-)